MPEFNIPYGFRPLNPEQLDKRFGPYLTLTDALLQTEGVRVPGMRVGVVNGNRIDIYTVQTNVNDLIIDDSGGIKPEDLGFNMHFTDEGKLEAGGFYERTISDEGTDFSVKYQYLNLDNELIIDLESDTQIMPTPGILITDQFIKAGDLGFSTERGVTLTTPYEIIDGVPTPGFAPSSIRIGDGLLDTVGVEIIAGGGRSLAIDSNHFEIIGEPKTGAYTRSIIEGYDLQVGSTSDAMFYSTGARLRLSGQNTTLEFKDETVIDSQFREVLSITKDRIRLGGLIRNPSTQESTDTKSLELISNAWSTGGGYLSKSAKIVISNPNNTAGNRTPWLTEIGVGEDLSIFIGQSEDLSNTINPTILGFRIPRYSVSATTREIPIEVVSSTYRADAYASIQYVKGMPPNPNQNTLTTFKFVEDNFAGKDEITLLTGTIQNLQDLVNNQQATISSLEARIAVLESE